MLKYILILVATSAVCRTLPTFHHFVPPAGRCRDDVTPLAFDFNAAVQGRYYEIAYVPDDPAFSQIDTMYRDVLWTAPNGLAYTVDRFRMKDNSVASYLYTYRYGEDDIVYENVVFGYGNFSHSMSYKLYILDTDPMDMAFLYYRCSDTGSLDIDTRLVAYSRASNLSSAGEQRFVDKDKTFGFRGAIRRLESKLGL